MASDEPILFYPLGCLSSLSPLVNPLSFIHWVVCPLWTKEKGGIRGHKEKKDRQPNGQKREGSSEAIKRTDNPMDKRERVVVCPSLYDL
jgi:hypothetical protein